MAASAGGEPRAPRRIGVVVHPARSIDRPLDALRVWAAENGAEIVQVPVAGQDRRVADPGEATGCDLLVSVGGDGTMLAAMRAAVGAGLPAVGVACGSLGVLTSVGPEGLPGALDAFSRGDWTRRPLPALQVACVGAPDAFALNDIAVLRAGIGQVRVFSRVDGILYSRWAGDGCIVSTPLGTSAYSLAAGGPLLMPDIPAFVLTPLPTHGGSRHPLVIGAGARLELEVRASVGGARLEIDGQSTDVTPETVTITLRPEVATVVSVPGDEPLFASLRRRQILADSPRILADESGDGG